jgi:hypothetical protein
MLRWGVIITGFYALILIVVLPGLLTLAVPDSFSFAAYRKWQFWLAMALPLAGQALLLFLSVDTQWRKRSPRRHIRVSVATCALFFAVLFVAAGFSLAAGIAGDRGIDRAGTLLFWRGWDSNSPWSGMALVLSYWILWAIVLTLYVRGVSDRLSRVMSWLIKGSVLELLIAVPAHIAARQRDDCCAEPVTALGIATGVAVMFAAIGPAVLLLYRQRLQRLQPRNALRP